MLHVNVKLTLVK